MNGRGKKIFMSSSAAFLAFLAAAAFCARFRPELFFKTGPGRAAGARLARTDFIRHYIAGNPELIINSRTVGLMIRETDMEDIDRFRQQLQAGAEWLDWASLPPERKSRYFEGLYDVERLPYTIAFLMAMPDEHRAAVVDFAAGYARDYRVNLTAEEAGVLSARLNSPEGRRRLEDARRYYLNRLGPGEMRAISPIVDEIVLLTAGMLK